MLPLKNQFIMATVKTAYGIGDGKITKKHLHFYALRAPHLGALIPEPLYIDRALRELPTQIGIDSEDKIDGLKALTSMLHSTATKAIAHLNHPGRMANPKIPGNEFISSTDKACEAGGIAPTRMDRKSMDRVIAQFVNAVEIAEKADFDVLELQFGHGYLMAQYISPFVNDRSDEYGGSFANRIKFPLEVLDAIIKTTKLPIIIRLSGDEMIPQGIHLHEMIALAKILKKRGVAAIHVSAGTICNTPPWYFQHMFVPKAKTWEMAYKIKQEVGIDCIYVGRINTKKDIDLLLHDFEADYIAVGRALIADPKFIGKYLNKEAGIIRPCMACSDGCLGGVKMGKGLGCLVNPEVNYSGIISTKEQPKKRFAVVGGGLAGCEMVYRLHQKGHFVSLFEPNDIGGQFDLAYLPPKKQTLKKIVDFYKEYLLENKIDIVRKEAQASDLRGYDEVIVATGSKAIKPKIPGLKSFYWAEILLEQNMPENKNIAIIGGGLIGTEVAHKLLENNNKVFLIELMSEIARGMEMIEKKLTLKNFKTQNIELFTSTQLKAVKGRQLVLEKEGQSLLLDNIDHIVVAVGLKSYHPFEAEDLKVPMHFIGDAKHVAKAQNAIADAFDLANRLA